MALGLVASFNQPGGNATGVFFLTGALVPKRLELLHEIVPAVTSIGFLRDPMGGTAARQVKEAEAAARILGVGLTTFEGVARQPARTDDGRTHDGFEAIGDRDQIEGVSVASPSWGNVA
jgi:hypothetical protein